MPEDVVVDLSTGEVEERPLTKREIEEQKEQDKEVQLDHQTVEKVIEQKRQDEEVVQQRAAEDPAFAALLRLLNSGTDVASPPANPMDIGVNTGSEG